MTPASMKYNPAFLGDDALIHSFVARMSELERILEVIRENAAESNQHLLIIGARGLGKTTLVLRSAAEIRTEPGLAAKWHPIVFGEETYQANSPGEFWLEALFHLGEQTGEDRWKKAYEELRRETDEDRLRGRVLAQLLDFADEHGKRLVLVVENLNMLVGDQLSGDDAWVLRHTLMNEPRIMLLGTATSRFREVEEYSQALYELFRIIDLEPLDEEEAQALWMATTGQRTTPGQIRPLQILTGGNPRLIRILSEFAAKTSFRSLMDDLTRLVDEHTEYFKHHLDNLPPQERKVFVALADLWDPSTARGVAEAARLDVNTTSALLKRLVDRGAVTVGYKRGRAQYYQVAERMYNIYHLMRRRGPAASRVHAVVRFMVSLYRDEELVRTTRSLVEEARQLTQEERREHFLAYEAILHHTREPRLTKRLVEATRYAFDAMPDVPASLQRLIGLDSGQASNSRIVPEEADIKTLLALRLENIDSPWLLLRLASVLAEDFNRLKEAEAAFRRALKCKPDDADAWQQFGTFLELRVHDHERALEAYDRALALDAENASAWLHRGALLHTRGRFEEALRDENRAVGLDPKDADHWYNRSITLHALGRYLEALESTERALALDAKDPAVWHNRAAILGSLGRFEEAVESYDQALALDALNPTVWIDRAFALNGIARHHDALESLDRALAIDAYDPNAWADRGYVLSMLERSEEALQSYDRALSLNTDDAHAWVNRGIALTRLGRMEEGLQSYEHALSLDPENGYALLRRGSVYRNLKKFQEAEADLRRAISCRDESASAVFLLVELLLKDLERPEEALLIVRENLEQLGASPEALDDIAWAFLAHGRKEDWGEAETWARSAVEHEPEDGIIRYTLASLLGAQGKWDDALEQAALFLTDRYMLTVNLESAIAFLINSVAAGRGEDVIKVIRTSGATEELEPLLVAIQRMAGAELDVAREILEVAKDVQQRIEARRQELSIN